MTPPLFPAGTLIPPRQELTLAQKVVRAVVLLAALGVVAGVGWLLRFLVVPLVLGMLLTYVLGPLADRLENSGAPRSRAVSLTFALLLSLLALVAWGIFPTIEAWLMETPKPGEQSAFELQLGQRIDGWQASLSASYPKVNWGALFEKLRDVLQHQRKALVEGLPAMVLEVLSHAGSVVLGLIIGFFVLLDGCRLYQAERR